MVLRSRMVLRRRMMLRPNDVAIAEASEKSGMCCMSIAHWIDWPDGTMILAFDIMPEEEFWAGIPEEVHACITYVRLDVIELSLAKLRELVQLHWGCGLSGVSHLH